jgi:alcohol dehydrogenase class IV
MDLSYFLPRTDLLVGAGVLSKLGEETAKIGKAALIVTGKSSMKRLGFLDKAVESLEKAGVSATVFSGAEPNPTLQNVKDGASLCIENKCDVVVALGGGSSMDAAKAIAIVAGHNDIENAWDYIVGKKAATEKTIPVIAVTSTSGSGSHVTMYSVVTNREKNEKAGFGSEFMFPRKSIYDVEIAKHMPPKVTAESGFDVLAHVMEAFTNKKSNAIVDPWCIKAIKLVAANLEKAFNNGEDLEARTGMAIADTLAGFAISAVGVNAIHPISNTLSGFYPEIAHGQALATVSQVVMKHNIENGSDELVKRYAQIARALGKNVSEKMNKQDALLAIEAVGELREKIGLGKGFSELGVSAEKFPEIAKISLKLYLGTIQSNPIKVDNEETLAKFFEESQ